MTTKHYIGLMSGTSLDGVDGVLVAFDDQQHLTVIQSAFIPYPNSLKQSILSLQDVGNNEIDRMFQLGNRLSDYYAQAVHNLLVETQLSPNAIAAIGCHGQTIRHAPQLGYTVQTGNLAQLAEQTQITVIGDFRSRDIAAGGQGAPLVPAFHQALFSHPEQSRGILNIGGIANLTTLIPNQSIMGFDIGPGNMLMDAWIQAKQHKAYDLNGQWAKTGQINESLLQRLLKEPYFSNPIPKSTGRDLFNLHWLNHHLQSLASSLSDEDVQTTLLALTAYSIRDAILHYVPNLEALYLCGGGANNQTLIAQLQQLLPNLVIQKTDALGLPTQQVEACAFAWLAKNTLLGQSGNLPSATGAKGPRILGAIYAK